MERSSLDGEGLRAEYDRLVAALDLLKKKHATALSELAETQNVLAETQHALARARSPLDKGVRIEGGTSSGETVEGDAAALLKGGKPGGGSSRVAPAPLTQEAWSETGDEQREARPAMANPEARERAPSSQGPDRRMSRRSSKQDARRASAHSDDPKERRFDGVLERFQLVVDTAHNLPFALCIEAIAAWEREQTGDAALAFNDDGRSFLALLVPIIRKQQQFLKFMEAVSIVQETLAVVIDQFMDTFLIVVLSDTEQRDDAFIMLCMLGVAYASMGLLSFFSGQGPRMTVLSLLGLKPIVEGWRQLTGADARPGQVFNNDIMFALTRVMDAAMETIPQSFFQSMVFFSSRVRQVGQWISLGFGLLNICISVAGANQFLDTLETYRKIEPLYYGYFPGDAFAAFQLHVAEMGFVYFYAASKLAAVGMLGAASKLAVVRWLAVECMVLLVVRKCATGSWRWYQNNAMHGFGFSLFAHVCCYACMLASPFTLLRAPFLLSPAIYSGFLAYSLCVANPAMIALGFFLGADRASFEITVRDAVLIAGIPTLLCLGCAALVWQSMVPEFRKSFTSHVPLSKHVVWWWYEAEHYMMSTGNIFAVEGGDRDALRWTT